MIISCPSCEAKFRADDSRFGPDGRKVRCSKCGHVWLVAPSGQPVVENEAEKPPSTPPAAMAEPEAVEASSRQPADRESKAETTEAGPEGGEEAEPTRGAEDGDDGAEGEQEAADDEETGADGLTEAQRSRLSAARENQTKSRSGFRMKILLIFIVVGLLLYLALKMGDLQIPGLKKSSSVVDQPAADVGQVDAKPIPPQPTDGGHIVGEGLPE